MHSKLLNWIDAALFGSVLALRRANRRIQSELQNCTVEGFKEDPRLKHSEERLDGFLADSVARMQRVEQKAMGTLLGVSVAVVVLGAASWVLGPGGMLGSSSATARIVAAVALVAAMAFLFGSGFLALQAYRIGELYRPTLEDCEPLVDANHRAQVQLYCIEQNGRVATLRANRLSASFNCLRSGLAVVVLIGILIVVMSLLNEARCGGV